MTGVYLRHIAVSEAGVTTTVGVTYGREDGVKGSTHEKVH
jgi:hypothetical protein